MGGQSDSYIYLTEDSEGRRERAQRKDFLGMMKDTNSQFHEVQ